MSKSRVGGDFVSCRTSRRTTAAMNTRLPFFRPQGRAAAIAWPEHGRNSGKRSTPCLSTALGWRAARPDPPVLVSRNTSCPRSHPLGQLVKSYCQKRLPSMTMRESPSQFAPGVWGESCFAGAVPVLQPRCWRQGVAIAADAAIGTRTILSVHQERRAGSTARALVVVIFHDLITRVGFTVYTIFRDQP